jgi:hypothetical protein
MGIYWTSFLYFGKLLSPETFLRLQNYNTVGFIRKVCHDRWVLHAPGRCITMGSMDPALEEYEKKSGVVSEKEVTRWL